MTASPWRQPVLVPRNTSVRTDLCRLATFWSRKRLACRPGAWGAGSAFGVDTEVGRMHFGRNTTWRRTSRVRPALIATLIAIPLASGIAVGVIAANHSGNPTSQLKLSAHNFGIGH